MSTRIQRADAPRDGRVRWKKNVSSRRGARAVRAAVAREEAVRSSGGKDADAVEKSRCERRVALVEKSRCERRVALVALASSAALRWNDACAASMTPTALHQAPARTRVGQEKRRLGSALSRDEFVATLTEDVRDRQYFVTGRLTEEIFADDCRFVDPTTDVVGLSRYLTALAFLFDPARSSVQLLGELSSSELPSGGLEIVGRYRAQGYLRLPWNPKVAPYEGRIVWTVQGDDGSPNAGLIVKQTQTWSVSGLEALRETFTPS